jgi:peptide chain release factor 1
MYAESDEAFRAMAKEEITLLEIEQSELEESIRLLLIPKDPEDIKNAVLEIRAGTGGDEASIFAGDLARMYMKFCENKGWKVDVIDQSDGTLGGFKEIVMEVSGDNVFGILKYE